MKIFYIFTLCFLLIQFSNIKAQSNDGIIISRYNDKAGKILEKIDLDRIKDSSTKFSNDSFIFICNMGKYT